MTTIFLSCLIFMEKVSWLWDAVAQILTRLMWRMRFLEWMHSQAENLHSTDSVGVEGLGTKPTIYKTHLILVEK